MSSVATLRQRRQRLARHCDRPILLWSGARSPRNFPHNPYPFRASSHFLYFAGLSLERAAIRLEHGRAQLFCDAPSPDAALWHGETPSREELAEIAAVDAVYPWAELSDRLQDVATIAVQDAATCRHQSELLHRPISPYGLPVGIDLEAARAVVATRLTHDATAIDEIRTAARITISAHLAGMAATTAATREYEVRAAMEYEIARQHVTCAYPSIVTTHGEVLHSDRDDGVLHSDDLLLADVGAETRLGWAADVTRTWPVSGTFSATQRAVYDIVLAAHD
ncbi:MAG: aminopeptidase P N-terminal domain-containing protein, partial [Cyanobacteria bacterium P01_D01_bin.123]